jgi:poly-gamma-glutamate capsule biosynthesis protein CapA/YwtB (metallophosphatase superfamily)
MRFLASAALALIAAFGASHCTASVAAPAAATAAPVTQTVKGQVRIVGGVGDLAALDVRVNGDPVGIAPDGSLSGRIGEADLYRLTVKGPAIFDAVSTFAASEVAAGDGNIILPAVEAVSRAPGRIEMFFGGDVMMGRRFEAPLDGEPTVIREANRAADMARLLDPMKPYFTGADLASVNLETVLATRDLGNSPGKSVVFYTHSDAARALVDAGIDYVTLGNNHVYDYVEPGLASTLAALDAVRMPWSGAGRDEAEALKAARLSVGGHAWSMLGFVGWKGNVEPNQVAESGKGGAALGSDANIEAAVRGEVAAGRTPIVQYHGSTEYSARPTAISERRMKLAIDSGAALVVSHHPHVAHGLELYKGHLIAYSLGNFLFDQSFPETHASFALRVWMDGDRLFRAEMVPIQILDYRPVPAVGGMRQAVLGRIIDLSAERGTRIGIVGGHGVIQPSAPLAPPQRCAADAGSGLNVFRYDLYRPEAACRGDAIAAGHDLLARGDFEAVRFGDARDRSWSIEGGAIDFDRDAHAGRAALAVSVPGAGAATVGPKVFFRPVAERRLTFTGWVKLDAPATLELLVQEQRKGSGRTSALANAPRQSAGTQRIAAGGWQPFRFEFDRGAETPAQPLRPLLRIEGASRALLDDLALIAWGGDAPGQSYGSHGNAPAVE